MDRIRRIVDRGPLLTNRSRADAIAAFLRTTGLYESVQVIDSRAVAIGGAHLSAAASEQSA
jgi:hypothetical protein